MKPLYNDVVKISSSHQALQWLRNLLEDLKTARFQCDVLIPDEKGSTVENQRKAERHYLIQYGGALGVLRALHAASLVDDMVYESIRVEIVATVLPTTIGMV